MEGRTVLIMGAGALVALLVIVLFFTAGRSSPYVPTTVVTAATNFTTSIYTATTTVAAPTTTVPQNETPAWFRFNGDLGMFKNVTAITLTYNATEAPPQVSSGSVVTLYKLGGNVSFDTAAVLQGFDVPARVYLLDGNEIVCGNLPNSVYGSALTCLRERAGFPDMINYTSLNATAYSNVAYDGVSSVNGDSCDNFSASISHGEAGRLLGDIPGSYSNFDANVCVNKEYGYPDYVAISSGGARLATVEYQSSFLGLTSSATLQPPSNFSVDLASCANGTIQFEYTPFYNTTDPSFAVSAARQNSTATGIGDSLAESEVTALESVLKNSTLLNMTRFADNGTGLAIIENALKAQLSKGSIDNQSAWDLLNTTGNYSIGLYQNATVMETVLGNFTAMDTYGVSLGGGNLTTALGFDICNGGSCQLVTSCPT
jgi:hypothetical protein